MTHIPVHTQRPQLRCKQKTNSQKEPMLLEGIIQLFFYMKDLQHLVYTGYCIYKPAQYAQACVSGADNILISLKL